MSILRNKHNGWTWNMERHLNKGGFNPIEIISDAVSSVGDALADIDPGPAIGKAGTEIDTFVNREIPGGWVLPAAVAAAVTTGYFDPSLLAAEGATTAGFTGATETGLATLAGEGAVADTVGTTLLSGGGGIGSGVSVLPIELTPEMIPTNIPVDPGISLGLGQYNASVIPMELTAEMIPTGIPEAPGISLAEAQGSNTAKDVLVNANRARTLANMLTGQTGGQMGMNQPNMGMPAFEQFGGLYRGNQSPFLVDRTAQVAPLQQTQNFLQQLAEQGKPNDLASLLRNV